MEEHAWTASGITHVCVSMALEDVTVKMTSMNALPILATMAPPARTMSTPISASVPSASAESTVISMIMTAHQGNIYTSNVHLCLSFTRLLVDEPSPCVSINHTL